MATARSCCSRTCPPRWPPRSKWPSCIWDAGGSRRRSTHHAGVQLRDQATVLSACRVVLLCDRVGGIQRGVDRTRDHRDRTQPRRCGDDVALRDVARNLGDDRRPIDCATGRALVGDRDDAPPRVGRRTAHDLPQPLFEDVSKIHSRPQEATPSQDSQQTPRPPFNR